jgi:hypothetical protein
VATPTISKMRRGAGTLERPSSSDDDAVQGG